jgi:ATP-dependent DNA ligase
MALPTLYCKSKTGKTQVWNIEVIEANIRVSYGYEGGTVTVNEKTITSGKNLGKKNATTAAEQAVLEARSTWDKKKTGGYAESLDDAHVPGVADAAAVAAHEAILPMLAHDYHKRGKDIKFPCYVQAKLDGVRCIFKNGILTSRQGKVFPNMEHIVNDLKDVELVLDGELYSDTLTFQQFVGLVRKKKHNAAEKVLLRQVKYWVYDCVNDKPFSERNAALREMFVNHEHLYPFVQRLNTEECKTKSELKGFHDRYVADGKEGLIIRNSAGLYQLAARSKDLQKYKEFEDAEFTVVEFTDGEGSEKGLVIWVCETEDKKKFSVRPRGTHEDRAELFNDAESYVGKKLTVRYQELTEDGIPRFPVGIAFRDYE